MSIPRITLEQWRVLQAVVDQGGFAQAAEALNRSQSSVSYAIGRLQEQLPVPVLEPQGRRAQLTEAGQALLHRARALVDEALALERLAANLAQGWEAEIRLAVEMIFPPQLLLGALDRFAADCHQTRIQVLESVLSGTDELLLEGRVELAVGGRVPPGFLGTPLLPIEFLAVAHPSHPLHRLNRPLGLRDLRPQRQIVVRDSGLRRNQDASWLGAEQRWTVSHLGTAIDALRRGLGFAWVPREHIRQELEQDLLRPLTLTEGASARRELYLIYADRDNAGPAARRLGEILQEICTGPDCL
ncbi:MAG: LysR family transcriptional regulator [Candidatus Competibacteraceae bacterium]|nr:LysR family transcriptional regulator [Candidatus Competibacteraceae bacterium]